MMRREHPSTPIPGVAATVFYNNCVLLSVRGKPPSKGKWGLPGGAVETGETLEEAVIREVKEETNVTVHPVKLITFFDSITRDEDNTVLYHYILFEYLCEYVSGEVKPMSDAPDARWIPFYEIENIDIMKPTLRFIKKVLHEEKPDAFQP
jgi:8-oxo-dGTP diphosphatase